LQVTGGRPLRPQTAKQRGTGFEPLTPPAAAGLRPFANEASGRRGLASPAHKLMPTRTGSNHARPRRPCHPHAITGGQPWYRADNHGHLHSTAELGVTRSCSEERITGTCLIGMRSLALERSCDAPGSSGPIARWPKSVGGRGSPRGGGRTPQAGVGASAASGSRSWCRRRGGTAGRWRPPQRWWPGRRRAAPRTAAAVPRSAGPGLGRAKSPPEQAIELMFEIPSAMLRTATGRIVGHIGGTEHRSARVNSGQSRQARILVDGRLRRCAAGPEPACFALLRQRFGPVQTDVTGRRLPGRRIAIRRLRYGPLASGLR
jgi:hypothetical protein